MTRRTGALLAVVVLAAMPACGIPADESPRAITQERVPEDASDGAEVAGEGTTLLADLFFTRFDGNRNRLVVVEREVPTAGGASTPTPSIVVEALLAGTEDDEGGAGNIVTKIPADTALSGQPRLVGGVLTVDLNGAISGVTGPGAPLAYGQMVCTVDALDEVDSVRFTVEGQPVQPPTGDGDTSDRPLTCLDYANLIDASQG